MALTLRKRAVSLDGKSVEITFAVCDALEEAGFRNAFSTRLGGVSPMPENALHLSPKNDSESNYHENRRRFLSAIDAADWNLQTANQTHSDVSILASSSVRNADAILTADARTLVGIKTADCVPLLIGDRRTGAVAAVHAGWRGTLQRITEKALAKLTKQFQSVPSDCVAAIGPSACGDCYEVGPEVVEQFRSAFAAWPHFMKVDAVTEKANLNVAEANRRQLLDAGVRAENIHVAPYCTMHQNDLFFSHRRERGHGRLLSVIGRP